MSNCGPWSSVDWLQPTPQASRREAPSIVLSDQDSALFGVAPEYDRLVVAECLFCDAVRRIECIAQHMLDEHPEELEKKTTELCSNRVCQNSQRQLSEPRSDKSQPVEDAPKLALPPGAETLLMKKKNSSRRRVRSSNVPIIPEADTPSTSCKPCCYALGACKAHPVRHRRAVRGRRTSYDELVLEHRARANTSGSASLPERSAAEMSEGSMSAESPAASAESKSDLHEIEITAELDVSDQLRVPAIDGVPVGIEIPAQDEEPTGLTEEIAISRTFEDPPDLGVSAEIEYLAGTEIIGEVPTENEVAAETIVFAEIEVPQESEMPSVGVEFPFDDETLGRCSPATDGMVADGLEITGEEILTTTTMDEVPTNTAGILHITDAALSITDDISQLNEPKAPDELTTIYEVIAIDAAESTGIENEEKTEENTGAASVVVAQPGGESAVMNGVSSPDEFSMIDTQPRDSEPATTNLRVVSKPLDAATSDERKPVTEYGISFPRGPPIVPDSNSPNRHPGSTAVAPADSLPSPLLVKNSTTLLSDESSRRIPKQETAVRIDDASIEEDFTTDAQSSVFLDDTANRFAVIVDPNKDTILSSLLFPNRYVAESDNMSEIGLRSTTSSTDQLFPEPATGMASADSAVAVHDGKLRNLLTRGRARSRSKHYHRRTERASHDSPGSSGAAATNSPSTPDDVVAIPFKKPRIHLMMQAQANYLSRICRLTGQSLPDYLRVYLRRPQLVDLREQQSSPMSMPDDLSEVLE